MGAIIKSVSFIKPKFSPGITHFSKKVAKDCLRAAGTKIDEIDLLIDTSQYSEDHISEPAMAAIIQNKLQKTQSPHNIFNSSKGKLFSFDLHNSSNGIINAIQIIEGFMETNEIESGLIISGDIKPTGSKNGNYKYANGGGAILISSENGKSGFTDFYTDSFPDFADDLKSIIDWDLGKFRFEITQSEKYLENCIDCTAISVNRFLKNKNLKIEDIDLLLTSESPVGFGFGVQDRLNSGSKVLVNENKEYYSSGFIQSLKKVFYNGKFKSAKNILFVTVGAGITVSIALYKNQ